MARCSYLVTVEHTERARAQLGAGGFLAVEQAVVLGEDRAEYLRRAHEHLNIYTGLENYRASWRRLGFGDDDFIRGGSDRLCDALVVHGDVETIGRRVDEHLAARCGPRVPAGPRRRRSSRYPTVEWGELGSSLTSR